MLRHGGRYWVVRILDMTLIVLCGILDQLFNTPYSFTLVYVATVVVTTVLECIEREERDARLARERDGAVEAAEDFVWNHTSKRGH